MLAGKELPGSISFPDKLITSILSPWLIIPKDWIKMLSGYMCLSEGSWNTIQSTSITH